MKQYLIPQGGNFYKANMHMHTTMSDGQYTPEEVKQMYKEQGYSILAYTDHEIMIPHNDLADDSFLPITSYEFAVNEWHREGGFPFMPCYHINFYAKDPNEKRHPIFVEARIRENMKQYITDEMRAAERSFCYSVDCMNDIIRTANEMGFLVSYNHPYWSLQNYNDYVGLEGVWGVEFMNTGCVVEGYHLDCDVRPIEDMLRANKRVYPLATDDAHRLPHCFGGHIMVKADKLEYHTVMNALERGDFYASTGPQIHELFIEDGVVHVSCSEAVRISLTTERRVTRFTPHCPGKLYTEADFDITTYLRACDEVKNKVWDPYFRITVLDQQGNVAHSRAYFVDELKR